MENNKEGLKIILDRIEKETEKECRTIIQEAEVTTEKIEKEIKKGLNEKKAELIEKHKRLAESEKLKLISEEKNKLVKEKGVQKNQLVEDVIAKGLELAKKELDKKMVKKWIEDGLKEIGEKDIVITVPMRFKNLKIPHKKIIAKKIDDIKIETKDGSVRIVESLEKKLNENKNLILVEVSKILFS
jgi:vacuolar-type H+-ATPase subunit E/Vma4